MSRRTLSLCLASFHYTRFSKQISLHVYRRPTTQYAFYHAAFSFIYAQPYTFDSRPFDFKPARHDVTTIALHYRRGVDERDIAFTTGTANALMKTLMTISTCFLLPLPRAKFTTFRRILP